MEIIRTIKEIGSYRAVIKSDLGIFHIAELEECSGGYEAFLYFKSMNAKKIEYKKEGSKKWKTVFSVKDGKIETCDESIFKELTVKDAKGIKDIEKSGKAFKVYDIVNFLNDSIELKLK
jgi:hypothetical protein